MSINAAYAVFLLFSNSVKLNVDICFYFLIFIQLFIYFHSKVCQNIYISGDCFLSF